jgi:hypothetical protein
MFDVVVGLLELQPKRQSLSAAIEAVLTPEDSMQVVHAVAHA